MYLEETISTALLELVSTKLLVEKDTGYIRYRIPLRYPSSGGNERSEFDSEIGSKNLLREILYACDQAHNL